MLNYLHFKMFYSLPQNLDDLFIINVLKNKIDSCSIMDTAGSSNISNVSRCVTAASNICKFLGVYKNITSPWTIHFPFLLNTTELRHYRVTYIILLRESLAEN
jgi:hypothetical protein